MILSNVNIGTGPSVGDGDPLRTAFNTINNNFAKIQSNVNALTDGVTTVVGRTGNIVLTTLDIIGINNYATVSYVSSQIANVTGANISALESNVASLQADVNTLYGNAGVQSSTLATLTSNAAAQAGSLSTLTANAASQAGELTTLLSNAAVQAGEIASLLSNAGSQHEAITSLQSNAATQAGQIAALQANIGVGSYGDSNVASYLTSYGGNVTVGNVIFEDLSVQNTAYTGTQWRSNLSSNLTVKPSWLSYVPGLKNQQGTQYGFATAAGFDPGGMFFAGNSDNDFAYPIQTNLHYHESDVLVVEASLYFSHVGNDHGLCIFPVGTRPIWVYSTNSSRIAYQFSAGTPRLYGQTTQSVSGSPILTPGDWYTVQFTYDPTNTVTVKTFSGNTATGSALDTRTISETLPAGDYKLGFDADNDTVGVKSYWTNLTIRTLTDTVVNDLEVQGQVNGNLIPSANVTYSLGNITHQWKDLWVSNNTIYINSVPLSIDAGGNLLVNDAPVSAGTATGIASASTISITNADSNGDINILSGDDITLQGKNKTTSDNEGGDIFIYAGNGGDADEFDTGGGGGDITIKAGQGGLPSAAYSGGPGGTVDVQGGDGADADPGNNRFARDGGRATLRAGSAGYNGGNANFGAEGGPVEIQAGQTTLQDSNGGIVTITSGQGGANALAGYVEINIPSSDLGQGGSWYFTGTGRTLEAPQDGEIWQPNSGNLSVASAGNVFIRSYDGVQHEWQFGHTGDLTLPGNIVTGISELNFVASSSGDGGGYTTMQLVPDNAVSGADQYIIIDPTVGAPAGHIHIRAGGTQDDSTANLYLGGENSYFKVSHGSNPPVAVAANSYEWIFGSDGRLQLPEIGEASSEIFTSSSGISIKSPNYTELRYSSNDPANVSPTSNVEGYIWITSDGAHIQNYHGGEFNHEWVFGTTGNITFPDTTIQSTAWLGSAPEIDVTDTNGLTTIYYPTFVENRTTGQTARADVNLTYRTDDNILGVGNIAIGATGNIKFADGTVQTTAYTGGGSYGNIEVSRFLSTQGIDIFGNLGLNVGSIRVETTGNIVANGLFGNIYGTYYFANGTPVSFGGSYGNAEVSTYLSSYDGSITFTASPAIISGLGTISTVTANVSGSMNAANISATGSITTSGVNGKIGYSAGGYVIQSGNTSGVTLNTVSGNIQLDTVNIATNTSHTVALTSNKLDANDIILVQGQDSNALDLHIGAYYLTTNTALIYLRNITGSSIGPISPKLKFIIVKAPSS